MQTLSSETQKRLILSILNAHTKKGIPWGITPLGWQTYTSYPDPDIRKAALEHPYCPVEYHTITLRRRATA